MPKTQEAAADPTTRTREEIGRERLLALYERMLLIRRFEEQTIRSYQAKHIAGFLHTYIGTEAVATAFLDHLLPQDCVVTSYRCHAQALLLGLNPKELMAELYGKVTGNVRGKGGSMHFFSKEKNFLGGHGIVGGQTPIGTGGAFACKYRKNGGISVTFMGDGAVAQGTFHESLNLASLWSLPALYLIENNQWGMGTACDRALAVSNLAEDKAPGYNVKGYTIDGVDLFGLWKLAKKVVADIRKTSRPVIVEAKSVRFVGHSVSDAQPYRTRADIDELRASKDCLDRVSSALQSAGWADQAALEAIDQRLRAVVAEAVAYAEASPVPPMSELKRHVLAE